MKGLIKRVAWFSNYSMKDFEKTQFAKLQDRSLLILHGTDTRKLLQGITTADLRNIRSVEYDGSQYQKMAIYTLFLQPKGKIVTDAFIFQPRMYQKGLPIYSPDQLWIDIDRRAKNSLKQHFKRHMWRKQVDMHDVDEGDEDYKPVVYAGYNPSSTVNEALLGGSIELEELQSGEQDTYANLIYYDPRGKNFGLRVVSMQPQLEVSGHFSHQNKEERSRMLQRIGQVPFDQLVGRLPFQFNFDMMNAISLKKGCFLGQEIVSRGLMAGIVRRRLFPFVAEDSTAQIEAGTVIKDGAGDQLGKVVFSEKGQGLALVSYIPLLQKKVKWPIELAFPFRGTLLNPFQEELVRYYGELKQKQKILQDLQL